MTAQVLSRALNRALTETGPLTFAEPGAELARTWPGHRAAPGAAHDVRISRVQAAGTPAGTARWLRPVLTGRPALT